MNGEQGSSDKGVETPSGLGVGSFILGALLGAGVALLLAPRTGAEIQERIKRKAKEVRESAQESLTGQNLTLETRIEDLRDGIESQIRLVKDIVESSQKVIEGTSQEFGELFKGSKKMEEEGSVLPEKLRISGEISFEDDDES